jgi:hypothetical protein
MRVHGEFDVFSPYSLPFANFVTTRMNRRKAEFKFVYKYLEDDL